MSLPSLFERARTFADANTINHWNDGTGTHACRLTLFSDVTGSAVVADAKDVTCPVCLVYIAETDLRAARADVLALSKFKSYVHVRLDKAGVPENPSPPVHALQGCRVGDRLDHLIHERDTARALVAARREHHEEQLASIDRLTALVPELRTANENLTAALARADKAAEVWSSEAAKAQANLAQLTAERDAALADVVQLKLQHETTCGALEIVKRERAALEVENRNQENSIAQLTAERDTAREEIVKLSARLTLVGQDLDATREECASLSKQVNRLTNELDNEDGARATIAKLTAQRDAWQIESNKQSKRVDELAGRITELDAQIETQAASYSACDVLRADLAEQLARERGLVDLFAKVLARGVLR